MKLAAAIVAYVVLVAVGAFALFLNSEVGALRHQVQAQRQVSTVHQQAEIVTLQRKLAAVDTQLAGEHRDLVTCGDLSDLGLDNVFTVNLANDGSGNIYATPVQTPITLPQHCINN